MPSNKSNVRYLRAASVDPESKKSKGRTPRSPDRARLDAVMSSDEPLKLTTNPPKATKQTPTKELANLGDVGASKKTVKAARKMPTGAKVALAVGVPAAVGGGLVAAHEYRKKRVTKALEASAEEFSALVSANPDFYGHDED